jgi:hypothetical protein
VSPGRQSEYPGRDCMFFVNISGENYRIQL